MSTARHSFEGATLTITEICVRVPALSRDAVVDRVARGHTTRQEMLAFDASAAKARGGARGRVASGFNGTMFHAAGSRKKARASGWVDPA